MPELNTVEDIIKLPPISEAMASTHTGFDREDMDTGGKSLGILEYCHKATSGEVFRLGSDELGTLTKLEEKTHFADGTALVDSSLMQFKDDGEDNFSYWRQGVKVIKTNAEFIQLLDGFKGYIGYNAAGELDNSVTDVRELIVRTPLVTFIYLNQTEGEFVWYGDERHGKVMDGQTHLNIHQDRKGGYMIAKGLDIHGIENNEPIFTYVESGNCGDEDVKMASVQLSTIPKIWMEGVNREWRIGDDDNLLSIFREGNACFNDISGTPLLSPIGSDRVVNHFMATHNKLAPIVNLIGQKLHATRSLARVYAPSEYARIKTTGLPGAEVTQIGSVIINNQSEGEAEVGSDSEIWYDHRFSDSTPRREGDND